MLPPRGLERDLTLRCVTERVTGSFEVEWSQGSCPKSDVCHLGFDAHIWISLRHLLKSNAYSTDMSGNHLFAIAIVQPFLLRLLRIAGMIVPQFLNCAIVL